MFEIILLLVNTWSNTISQLYRLFLVSLDTWWARRFKFFSQKFYSMLTDESENGLIASWYTIGRRIFASNPLGIPFSWSQHVAGIWSSEIWFYLFQRQALVWYEAMNFITMKYYFFRYVLRYSKKDDRNTDLFYIKHIRGWISLDRFPWLLRLEIKTWQIKWNHFRL